MRNKYIAFNFTHDIKEVQNLTGSYSMFKTGELQIYGRAKISPENGIDASDGSIIPVIEIQIRGIDYKQVDILPILLQDGCVGFMGLIRSHAMDLVHEIIEKDIKKKRITNKKSTNEISEDQQPG